MRSNLEKFGNVLKQEGTSRQERYMPSLDPAQLKLDDRRQEDLILYFQRYAKNLLFIDAGSTDLNLQESWEPFFRNDNLILLIANIAGRNVEELHTTYDLLYRRFTEESSRENFGGLLNFVLSRFRKLNQWYYASPADSRLRSDLGLYIYSYLQRELESLREMVLYVRNTDQEPYGANQFLRDFYERDTAAAVKQLLEQDDIWELPTRENTALREQLFAGADEAGKLYTASMTLGRIFDAVYHATENVVLQSKQYFEEVLAEKQQQPPHIAFLITFIKLFGYVQQELNQVPRRHLEFHYRDVLRINARAAVPDEAFVLFELAKGFGTYPLRKGTLFTAGKDKKGTELFYEVNDDLVINRAQVASLQAVFIARNKQNQTLNYYRDEIALSSSAGSTDGQEPTYNIFGGPDPSMLAEIGFGIASTQFYLAKGERNITITFRVQDAGPVEQYDTALLKLLLTGDKGWISSADSLCGIMVRSLRKTDAQTLELQFTIPITQEAAIVAFNPKLHAGNFSTAFPVLRCMLRFPAQQPAGGEAGMNQWMTSILQLNTLQNLVITGVNIRVQVGSIQPQASFDGIKDLLLENGEAPLDPKKPFLPFTAIPHVGTSFYIGCKDLYYKKIQRLSVNLEWALPDNFAEYYSEYTPPYDANRFMASLSLLEGKFWKKLDDIAVIDKEAGDPRFKSIRLDFDKLNARPAAPPASVPAFDNDRKDGTLRLKLKYPDFGHSIYSQLITSVVLENATSRNAGINYLKLVKEQMADSALSVKLPEGLDRRKDGPMEVVYDILEQKQDNSQAYAMIVKSLSAQIATYNNLEAALAKTPGTPPKAADGTKLVNDDNWKERLLRTLKKVRIIRRRIHYDEDRQQAADVVEGIKEKVNSRADFIMPSDRELVNVIISETGNAIRKTVAHAVEEMLELRAGGKADPVAVAALLQKEFDETNEVINDMIASKIATLLFANSIPPVPYTPLVNAISLSYTSSQDSLAGGDQFFHITPLGVSQVDLLQRSGQAAPVSMLPRSLVLNPDTKGQFQGMLFIGLKDLQPPQNVTMLVRISEGTRRNDRKPPAPDWWYRKNDGWAKLTEDRLVSDTTYGFQTTGIVEISMPADAGPGHELFGQPSLSWLCAAVPYDTEAFPRFYDIRTQAVAVTFRNQDNDPSRLALPLEARKITGFAETVPQVKKVSQPLASAGGQVQETGQDYFTRVSERLRHKNRALCNWDYERLVLEQFPFLFKVKCLNNYYDGHFAVGHVTVVPIASMANKTYDGDQLLIPRTSYIDLLQIERFLRAKVSPFVKVHAVNPELNFVLIRCKVKFHTGVDQGYYLQELNRDLIHFLTPWVSPEEGDISFSAKIYSSSIVSFIDKREYVDFVTDLAMEQYTQNERGERDFRTEADELTSLVETQMHNAHSILVSAPKHQIELV